MGTTPKWRRYLRFFGADPKADLAEEFRFHLETEIEDLVAGGMTPADARAEALRKFGDVARFERDCRAADQRLASRRRRGEITDVLRQDIKHTFRSLARQPGFAAIAVLTLGLGIGANTAVFSVVDGVLLSPLAFDHPERLVILWENTRDMPQITVSYPDYLDWRARNRTFEDIAIYNAYEAFNLTGSGEPERVQGGLASGNLFGLLGARPALGRLIREADDHPGAEPVAVLSDRLWRHRFGADPAIVGRSILLDRTAYTVVGVARPDFRLGNSDIWIPIGLFRDTPRFARENHPGTIGLGRLEPGVTLDQMQADLDRVTRQLQEELPKTNAGITAGGAPLMEITTGAIKPALVMLAGAVGLVLLVACANVANLLLARAASRQKEFALRVAIGAGRGRVIRQLLTESTVLALLGGILGVALAWAGVKLLVALRPNNVPRLMEIGIDGTTLAFAAAVSMVTGIAFGLVPAIQSARSDPQSALREEGRSTTLGRARHRARAGLTVAEVALALMLLVGAGLLLRSFDNLTRIDPGIDPTGVTAALIRLPASSESDQQRSRATFGLLIDRVRAQREVQSVALTSDLPLDASWQFGVTFEGMPAVATGSVPLVNGVTASAEYFATMAIPLISGRGFTPEDREGQPRVVVVSEAVGKRFFGAQNPVGRRLKMGDADSESPWATIVGVVGEVKNEGLSSLEPPRGTVYFPYAQNGGNTAWIVVRSEAPVDRIASMLRREMAAVDRDVPVAVIRTIDQVIAGSVAQPRFSTLMLTVFAALALVLAAVGLYGVISFGVSQRSREIGVRIALGAPRSRVVRMVVGQAMGLTGLGILIGGAGALAGGGLIARLLFGVTPRDPVVFGGVVLLLATVTLVAAALPAIRASRIDPTEVIK